MRFFNQFSFQTPESVELEFTLAGIGNRAYALIIDYIVLGLILFVALTIWAFLSFLVLDLLSNYGLSASALPLWLIAIQFLIFFTIYVGYFVFFETLWQGQTPGKKFVKIRVLCDDGKTVSIQQSTLRALLRPVDDFLSIGVFLIMLGKREKRLGDLVAGTIVIQEETASTTKNFTLSEEAQTLADKLLIEADISRLRLEDFAVIREYLRRQQEMIPQARRELCRKIAERIKDIISLEEIPEDVTANLFLEAVYLAYQQQNRTND
ncbi:MAG: RDD family protein [Hydrococcus sp. Prado102]|jgi:uncharacterized RDD family membrane protein YckC|nr:RDD family protein [Hydrococcus sp. Prado102]